MSINELFGMENRETTNARTLSGTAALTSISAKKAVVIIKGMESNIDEYRERIAESAKDHSEMDKLISEFKPWATDEEIESLKTFDTETVDGMLKSQQSKRSRAKGKAMTLDNYRSLMTAAIAENLLREIYNKPKSAGGLKRAAGSVDFTPAELEALEADQERLRKEIRNIQSKKSIMKSKADFDSSSEAWQNLLKAEQMLKDLRVGGYHSVVEVDHTKDALGELLTGIDLEHLKAADAKELLAHIKDLAN